MDEQAGPGLTGHVAADMALPSGVFSQQDRARPEHAPCSTANLDLDRAGEVHHELSARSHVEIEQLVAAHFTELNSSARPRFRDLAARSEVFEFDVHVLEMGLSVGTGEDAHDIHCRTVATRVFGPRASH